MKTPRLSIKKTIQRYTQLKKLVYNEGNNTEGDDSMTNRIILIEDTKKLVQKHQDTIIEYYKETNIVNKKVIQKVLKKLDIQLKDIS